MILVTGATGFIGRHLVETIAETQVPVRALVRPRRGREPYPWGESVSQIAGTVEDTEVLHRAMQGTHTVIHLASAPPWANARRLHEVDVEGTRNVVAVARSVRLGRLIVVSNIGADRASAYTLMRIKGEVEETVRSSGLAHTIIRCGLIFGPDDRTINAVAMQLAANPLLFFMPADGASLVHPLWVDDLVDVLIDCLDNPDTIDQTIAVGGPEYLSVEQAIHTVMRVTGMRRLTIPLQPYWLRLATNVFRRLMPRPVLSAQWHDLIAESRTADLNNISDRFGIRPARFEDIIRTYMPDRNYFREMLRYVFGGQPF
jgi:NADH dehydrogenase